MLKNYFKIAFRNFIKFKSYSVINISGLALGLASAILIFLWISDEVSYDNFYKDAASIFRINWDYKWNDNEGIAPNTPPPLAAAMVNRVPGVKSATRIYAASKMTVRYEDKFFNESRIFGADSNFFEFFNYEFISGDPAASLNEPNSVVLTEQTANKYFGSESPVGKFLSIGEEKQAFRKIYRNLFKVTGIIRTPPHNSHIQFDMLTSISSFPQVEFFNWSWVWMQTVTYIKLDKGVAPASVQSKIPAIVKKYAPPAFSRIGFSFDELIKNGGRWNFNLQPLPDIYLGSAQIGNSLGPIGNRIYVYMLSIIACFVLSIACINFMNLATAYSSARSKEIGIRKVLGSQKKMLIAQFLIESVIYSFFAMIIALFLVEISLPFFNEIAGKSLQFSMFNSPLIFLFLICLTLIVGLVSGSYPGFYLSSFKPVIVLKKGVQSFSKKHNVRNILVVLQFAITIGLIACTLLVQRQMDYVNKADLGFNKNGIIIINNNNNALGNKASDFAEKLKSHSQIINASVSTGVPPEYGFQDYYKVEGGGEKLFDLTSYMTDENFLGTLGVKLKEGRDFSRNFDDSASVILNESAVKLFGLKDPIGKIIKYPSVADYKVIGIVKDFNYNSLYSPIMPFAFFHVSSNSYSIPVSYVVVHVSPGKIAESIQIIEKEWSEFVPQSPFEFRFLDKAFDEQYLSDKRLGKLFTVFSCLTIFIACIGLLGLVSFSAQQRTKEIGIRKVVGASVTNILLLLMKDFLKLILIANFIALPVAWYAMNRWLQNFAYKVDMNIWLFLLAGVIAIIIACISIFGRTIKAAVSNPVDSLKYE